MSAFWIRESCNLILLARVRGDGGAHILILLIMVLAVKSLGQTLARVGCQFGHILLLQWVGARGRGALHRRLLQWFHKWRDVQKCAVTRDFY